MLGCQNQLKVYSLSTLFVAYVSSLKSCEVFLLLPYLEASSNPQSGDFSESVGRFFVVRC